VSIVATLVVGSDGSTSKESRSAGVSSDADRQVFLQRRREVDCIIIGGNTARHEPYNPTPVPLIVISLIEGGISMIDELIDHAVIDQLELSVTPASGGDERIDWKELLAKFAHCTCHEVEGTTFYSAHN